MSSKDEFDPAKGVKEDFSKLLEKFTDLESVRFELFANVWKSMKLSMLCAGRRNDRERREFFEQVTLVALSFYLPPYNFQVRVGGLYILYSVYVTQPCLPKVPIRVTIDQWNQIVDFQESMAHLDASFIFHKLFCYKAFQFVATPQEVYIKVREKSSKERSNELLNDNLSLVANSVNNMFTSDILQQLRAIHTQYHQLKLGIAGPHALRPDRSLDVISGDVIDRIEGCIDEHKTRQDNIRVVQKHRQAKRKKNTSDSEEESEVEDPEDSDYSPSKKASVKSLAFANRGKQSKSRRHRTLVTQDASSSSTEKTPRRSKKAKKNIGMSSASSQDDEAVWSAPLSTDQEDAGTELREEAMYLSMPTLEAGCTQTAENVEIELTYPSSPPTLSDVDSPKPTQMNKSATKESKKNKSAKESKHPKSPKSKAKKTPAKSTKKAKLLKVKMSPVKKKTQTGPKRQRQPSVTEDSEDVSVKAEKDAIKKEHSGEAKMTKEKSNTASKLDESKKSDGKSPIKIVFRPM